MRPEGKMFNEPSPEKGMDLKVVKEKLLTAAEAGDQKSFLLEVQRLNKFLMESTGNQALAEYSEQALEEVKEIVADFFEEVEGGWGDAIIPLSDNAWTRVVVTYRKPNDERLSVFINKNNSKPAIYELWQQLEGK